ncbi:MAG: MarR family transcriptional regulator [Chloroflexi bacterium]|nr:MarR family transcriptional regulator [Chloroflexota bacterium]
MLQQTHGLSNAELARNRNITPQTMNVILGRLEAAGLLVRKPHPEHGRILLAELTPTGESVVEQGLSRAAGVEACVSDALDSTERARLLQLLNRVADALTRASRL